MKRDGALVIWQASFQCKVFSVLRSAFAIGIFVGRSLLLGLMLLVAAILTLSLMDMIFGSHPIEGLMMTGLVALILAIALILIYVTARQILRQLFQTTNIGVSIGSTFSSRVSGNPLWDRDIDL